MSHHPNSEDYFLLGLFGLWLLAEADAEEEEQKRLEEEQEEEEGGRPAQGGCRKVHQVGHRNGEAPQGPQHFHREAAQRSVIAYWMTGTRQQPTIRATVASTNSSNRKWRKLSIYRLCVMRTSA